MTAYLSLTSLQSTKICLKSSSLP